MRGLFFLSVFLFSQIGFSGTIESKNSAFDRSVISFAEQSDQRIRIQYCADRDVKATCRNLGKQESYSKSQLRWLRNSQYLKTGLVTLADAVVIYAGSLFIGYAVSMVADYIFAVELSSLGYVVAGGIGVGGSAGFAVAMTDSMNPYNRFTKARLIRKSLLDTDLVLQVSNVSEAAGRLDSALASI